VTLFSLMEIQTDSPSSTWASREESATLPTTAQNVSANASLDATKTDDGNKSDDTQSAKIKSGDRGVAKTIAFESQDDVYTWPFELCRSYEVRTC
jgi:hypothetical protein